MRKLGDHPQVVTVLDTGEEDGNPFIVSRYMPGGDVEGLLAAAGGHLEVERAVEIAADVTRALEHAHARGIVHRDLKPANVWIDDDGHARLGDFGLATTEARARVSGGTLVGTVAYLPPEQALGEAAGPSSDLYSLGALLYEMLTGQPPFPGDDAVSIISQHLHADPVPPSRHNADGPGGARPGRLDLLAKRPEDRPANAAGGARADARRARGAAGRGGRGAARQPAREPRRRRLRRSRARARAAARGRGLGSRRPGLAPAAGRRAGDRQDARRRRSSPPTRASAARASTGAAAARTRAHPPTGPGSRRSAPTPATPTRSRSPGSSARGRPRSPSSSPRSPRSSTSSPASGLDSEEARFRLFDSVTSLLLAAARDRPIVIVLDDLHWADEPSLLLLRFAARELASSGLLILGTYRDVELGRHHPLARMLGEMSGDRGQRADPAARALDRRGRALHRDDRRRPGAPGPGGGGPGADRRQPVLRRRGGPPAGQRGQARPRAAAPPSSQIPQGVREVVGRRLDRLSEKTNEALRVAAVIGRDFDRGARLAGRATGAASS